MFIKYFGHKYNTYLVVVLPTKVIVREMISKLIVARKKFRSYKLF